MNIFNQQGQQVQQQYNAGGDIHVSHPNNEGELKIKIDQLIIMIQKAVNDGIIDATTAKAVKTELEKASSDKKNTVTTHLSKATEILKGISAAEGLTNTIKSLISTIGNWFL